MDNKKIFIANLSKGLLGESASNLLGSVLVAKFQLSAMARASMPEANRTDFHLFVDEFQNFATDSFASILSEARKFRLPLTLSHQYIDQLPETIRKAVFGNCGTIISFRVGDEDAVILSRAFGGTLGPALFSGLSNFEVCTKLLVDGEYGDLICGRTSPFDAPRHDCRDSIIRHSRQWCGTPRAAVEDKIQRWMQQ